MSSPLAEHFAALDGDREELPTDWRPFTAADLVEGELIEQPDLWANRWRRVAYDPDRGWKIEVELHATGDRVRLRLPVRLDPLPYGGAVIWGCEAITGEGSPTKQWYEQVGDETHLVVEAIH